jgi:Integrase core domain/Helix-turn-helix
MLPERSIDADRMVSALERLAVERGAPEYIRCDNGPELTAHALQDWCRFSKADTAYIEPGSPWQNPFVESFHSRMRDELLNIEELSCLAEAKVVISDWQEDYNQRRPHSALNMQTPPRSQHTHPLLPVDMKRCGQQADHSAWTTPAGLPTCPPARPPHPPTARPATLPASPSPHSHTRWTDKRGPASSRHHSVYRRTCGVRQPPRGGVARETGLHAKVIGRYERGVREPRVAMIFRLAKGLGVKPGEMMDGPDQRGGVMSTVTVPGWARRPPPRGGGRKVRQGSGKAQRARLLPLGFPPGALLESRSTERDSCFSKAR